MINYTLVTEIEDTELEITEADIERIEAKVKWYNPEKGYGFLIPDDESNDIFMHFSVLDAAGCRRVEEGDRIVCDIGPGRRGRQVLRVLEVKFVPREPRLAAGYIGQRSPTFDPESLEEIEGEVKWFNPLKGFGFVYPNDGGRDIFLHASVLRAAGYESLEPGIRVSLKVSSSERGREARILAVLR
ncbi:MAG: cold shock-like protein CspA [uncultured bacterium]|nr:MAG: cold shock-like protein CspA [uncultured bacterium]HBG34170.1 cold-shock protein [Holosporales bacterium]HBW24353.1 cold-shock protein [Holosporales bacterium]HCE95731.1 cold-shock protein [Holosporales bacterium]